MARPGAGRTATPWPAPVEERCGGFRPPSWSRTSDWPVSPGRSTTGRSCCRSRAGCSSRSRGRGTRSCCWLWPVPCAPPTTGSFPTTATGLWCSPWVSRPSTSCSRRWGRPRTRPRQAARCPATGARCHATSSPSRAPPAASAFRRWAAPRPADTSRGGRAWRDVRHTATSSPTCRSERGRRRKGSSGRASTPRAACTCRRCSWWPTTGTPSRSVPPTSHRHRWLSWCAGSGVWP